MVQLAIEKRLKRTKMFVGILKDTQAIVVMKWKVILLSYISSYWIAGMCVCLPYNDGSNFGLLLNNIINRT
jgi:hypothetical protein